MAISEKVRQSSKFVIYGLVSFVNALLYLAISMTKYMYKSFWLKLKLFIAPEIQLNYIGFKFEIISVRPSFIQISRKILSKTK